MLILLPPSETKLPGGHGPALAVDSLSFPGLNPVREILLSALHELAGDLPAARKALGVAASKDDEIAANRVLRSAGTVPAMDRYTGVLFDNLAAHTMTRIERSRAAGRLFITSALFGIVGAMDSIPGYRLSAGSKIPGLATIASLWRPSLTAVTTALDDLVIDLRSGSYAAFAAIPGAVRVQVMTENATGQRTIVSHFNKATKGTLARVLATSRAEMTDVGAVLTVARRTGLTIERTEPLLLTVLT